MSCAAVWDWDLGQISNFILTACHTYSSKVLRLSSPSLVPNGQDNKMEFPNEMSRKAYLKSQREGEKERESGRTVMMTPSKTKHVQIMLAR